MASTESMTSSGMPVPLIFTDAAAGKVKQLIEEEKNDKLKATCFCLRWRLFWVPVWLHF